jgi:hypothetical protein
MPNDLRDQKQGSESPFFDAICFPKDRTGLDHGVLPDSHAVPLPFAPKRYGAWIPDVICVQNDGSNHSQNSRIALI